MNVRFDGDLPEHLYRAQPKGRNLKQIDSEIVKGITATSGAVRPAGKPDSCDDALGAAAKHVQVHQTEFVAKESTEQTQRKSVDRQIGDSCLPVKRNDRQKGNPENVDEN